MDRKQKWAEIALCPQVTNLGYGPAFIKGVSIDGFYFQAGDGSAQSVPNNVGLPVFKLGNQLFFAAEHLWGPLGSDLFEDGTGIEAVVQELVERVKLLEDDQVSPEDLRAALSDGISVRLTAVPETGPGSIVVGGEMDEKMGGSGLPEGDFTWSTGSNYGMDGFNHADNYGEGVEEGVRWDGHLTQDRQFEHPQTGGFARLPDGVATGGGKKHGFDLEVPEGVSRIEDAFDLTEMLKEGSIEPGSLNDLEWLDPLQSQDPSRLPYDDHDALTELQEFWDSNNPSRSKAGVSLIPGTLDREAASYLREVGGYEAPQNPLEMKLANDRFKAVVQHAVRRASYGDHISDITSDAIDLLGPQAHRAAKALALIESEHGLLGNVFIRASAFPGLEGGQWADKLKKRASKAKYIIAAEGSTLAGYEVFLGKEVVQEVPWKEAFDHYAPRLQSLGHVIPKKGSYQERLKVAFENGPAVNTETRWADHKPIWIPPADQISLSDAKMIFANAPAQKRVVLDPASEVAKQARKQAFIRIAKWVKAEALDREQAIHLLASYDDPHELLREASNIMLEAETRLYQGIGEGALPAESKMASEDAWEQLAAVPPPQWKVQSRPVETMLRWARIQMTEGSAGRELDQLLQSRFSAPLRKEASQALEAVRNQHEGLSGHVYVDVAAYASKEGTVGCEAGALKHRANPLKFALEINRCATCVFKNAEDVCQKYNKLLVASIPVEDSVTYQVESIRQANMSDPEVTAALFANVYDNNDFNLGYDDQIDNIHLNASTDPEGLGEVLWGGMFLE